MKPADYPGPVRQLIGELRQLPGIGPRSAERVAIWLLQDSKADPRALAASLTAACDAVVSCEECGFFATEETCAICRDDTRDAMTLCVVEQAANILPLERSRAFRGRYHCLGGKLSPLDRVSPDDLRLSSLLRRIESHPGCEVILALGSDVEGEATAHYVADLLRDRDCRISRIAQGLPAGGGLEHADELTLMRALQGRRVMGGEASSIGFGKVGD